MGTDSLLRKAIRVIADEYPGLSPNGFCEYDGSPASPTRHRELLTDDFERQVLDVSIFVTARGFSESTTSNSLQHRAQRFSGTYEPSYAESREVRNERLNRLPKAIRTLCRNIRAWRGMASVKSIAHLLSKKLPAILIQTCSIPRPIANANGSDCLRQLTCLAD